MVMMPIIKEALSQSQVLEEAEKKRLSWKLKKWVVGTGREAKVWYGFLSHKYFWVTE